MPAGKETAAMPLIEMKEITKTYAAGAGRVQALDGVSLSIGAGE